MVIPESHTTLESLEQPNKITFVWQWKDHCKTLLPQLFLLTLLLVRLPEPSWSPHPPRTCSHHSQTPPNLTLHRSAPVRYLNFRTGWTARLDEVNFVVSFGRKILYPGVFTLMDQSKEDIFIFRYFDWISLFVLKMVYPGVKRQLLVFSFCSISKFSQLRDTAVTSSALTFCVRVFICLRGVCFSVGLCV